MIKVEIKPISDSGSSLAQEQGCEDPTYLKKTIKIFGLTIFTKTIKPIKKGGGYEYFFN